MGNVPGTAKTRQLPDSGFLPERHALPRACMRRLLTCLLPLLHGRASH